MDESEVALEEIIWDRPEYFYKGLPFIPKIYEGSLNLPIPSGFNAVRIKLDGSSKADLNWEKERALAQRLLSEGYALFWDIDLGLFNRLTMPLDNQAQFLSLTLTLEHFRDTLWQEFRLKTLGVSIFRGSLDFSDGFTWDAQQISNLKHWIKNIFQEEIQFEKETSLFLNSFDQLDLETLSKSPQGLQLRRLFCRDAAVEYLALLATRLPDALPCYLFLDASSMANPLWEAQLLNPEKFDHLNLALKGNSLPWNVWRWGESQIEQEERTLPHVGICFPPTEMYRLEHYTGLEKALESLISNGLPFRVIAENHLITCWQGLDYLIFIPEGLSSQGKRKLQGFCAAGGTVVSTSKMLGLTNEMTFHSWQDEA
jgi:hypothetical protein